MGSVAERGGRGGSKHKEVAPSEVDSANESNEVWEQCEPFRFSLLLCLNFYERLSLKESLEEIVRGKRALKGVVNVSLRIPHVAQQRLYPILGTAQLLDPFTFNFCP
jgi:hypothetical protein